MSHLGPDGATDYTASIAECVAALWHDVRSHDPNVRSMKVAWSVEDQTIVTSHVPGIAAWDPFARNVGIPLSLVTTVLSPTRRLP